MALLVLHSNRVERLKDHLAGQLAAAPVGAGPLDAETVLLDNPSLGPWINLQLALANGVAANIRYQRLATFFWDLTRRLIGGDIPASTPLGEAELRWRLLGLLSDPEVLDSDVMQPVRTYLEGSPGNQRHTDLKRFQLAARVADLFDQYQVFRPDWIRHGWDAGKPAPGDGARPRSAVFERAEAWQRELWRQLRAGLAGSAPIAHRSDAQYRLLGQLQAAAPGALEPGFRRLFVFGVTAMPSGQLEMLMALARHVDIFLYLLNPCQEYWFDVRDERRIMHLRKQGGDTQAVEIGNPLLAGQGRQVQDFLNLLLVRENQYLEGAQIQDQQLHAGPDPQRSRSLLAAIQQDILELQYRGEFARFAATGGTAWPVPAAEQAQPSMHFHNCHGPLREVEVLHDQLLDLFDRNSGLKPRDVVVMMPRVGPYLPYIRAVFERAAGPQRIPYHVNDVTLQEASPILNSFQSLLELPDSRLPLSEVLGLLEVPAIHRRFGLEREDYEQLKSWLVESGARWGLDAPHRQAEVGVAYREFSWAFGLDRLLSGYAMQADEHCMPNGVLPLDEIEGGQAAALDGFLRFWQRLGVLREQLPRPRSPAAWHTLLQGLLDDFYAPGDEEARALNTLREGIDELRQAEAEGWHNGDIALSVVRAAVQPVLARISERRHPWSEGVKFCSLLPMRGVPFEVVYLLGMNMDDYPRRVERPSFDLLREDYRAGDRSARIDDRWLFLEALLSARRAFHVSYIGQDMHRNEPREPSVVVQELMDYIRDGYQVGNALEAEAGHLHTRHPLQPFSADYFQGGTGRRFSFNAQAFQVARAQQQARRAIEPAADDARWQLAAPAEEAPLEVSLEDFVRFFADPPRWFFRQRGISLDRYEDTVEDEELWALERGLGSWQARHRLFERARLGPAPGDDPAAALDQAVQALVRERSACAQWPLGSAGLQAAEGLRGLKPELVFLLAGKTPEHILFNYEISDIPGHPASRLLIAGALTTHDGHYLEQSPSSAAVKHLLAFYLRLAALLASLGQQAPSSGHIAFNDTARPADPRPYKPQSLDLPLKLEYDEQLVQRSRALLAELAGLYLACRDSGLPFHAEASLDLFLEPGADRLGLIEQHWNGDRFNRGISHDDTQRAYYASPDALAGEAFSQVSRQVWQCIYRWLGREGQS